MVEYYVFKFLFLMSYKVSVFESSWNSSQHSTLWQIVNVVLELYYFLHAIFNLQQTMVGKNELAGLNANKQ